MSYRYKYYPDPTLELGESGLNQEIFPTLKLEESGLNQKILYLENIDLSLSFTI